MIFLKKKNLCERNSNLVISNLHAFFTFTNAMLYLVNIISMKNYLSLLILSLGYAFYDIHYLLTVEKCKFNLVIIHHLVIIIANLWINYYKEEFILKMMAFNYLTEFTTPFLNLSIHLYQTKKTNLVYHGYNIFKVCNIILIASYFILRILLGCYLLTLIYNHKLAFFFPNTFDNN